MNIVCKASPYEGQDKFIYIHFCKEDCSAAYTLMEILARKGYRIWYVAQPMDANRVSEQLLRCTLFMPLYSLDAANNHDFRKVVTAAVMNGKEIVPVFLEDVELSPGMRLQFTEKKRINWYSMRCALEIKPNTMLDVCKGEERPEIEIMERSIKTPLVMAQEEKKRPVWGITTFEDEEKILKKLIRAKAEREEVKGEVNEEQMKEDLEIMVMKPVCRTQPIAEDQHSVRRRRRNEEPISKTVMLDEDMAGTLFPQIGRTVIIEEKPPILIRLKTSEVFEGRCGVTTVGRAEDNDICIPGETVSSHHLEIISVPDGENHSQIADCNSSNGTWIDGKRMERGGRMVVDSYIRLSLSKLEPCFILFGESADTVREKGVLAFLECRETCEMKPLLCDEITFGRNNPWEKGAFDEVHVSGSHAMFTREGSRFTITDMSSNGTRINGGNRIPRNIPIDLNTGDEIEMGRQHFVFTCVVLKEK